MRTIASKAAAVLGVGLAVAASADELELAWSARFTQDTATIEHNSFPRPSRPGAPPTPFPIRLIPVDFWISESTAPEHTPHLDASRMFIEVGPDGSVDAKPLGPLPTELVCRRPLADGRVSVLADDAAKDRLQHDPRVAPLPLASIPPPDPARWRTLRAAGESPPSGAPRTVEDLADTWEVSPRGDLGVLFTHHGVLLVDPRTAVTLAAYPSLRAPEGAALYFRVAFADSASRALLVPEVADERYIGIVVEYAPAAVTELMRIEDLGPGPARFAYLEPGGEWCLLQAGDGPIRMLRIGTGTGESTLPGRVAHVSVDGRRLLTYEGSTARVYRLAEGAFRLERQEIFGSVSLETCAAISPDGRHVAQLLRDPWRFVVLGAGGTALATLTESLTELNDTGVGVRFVTDATGALYLFQGSGPYGQPSGRLALYALSGPEGGEEE